MPFPTHRCIREVAARVPPRCSPLSLFLSSSSSSSLHLPPPSPNPQTAQTSVDEESVLEQLSHLVPIYRPFVSDKPTKPLDETRRVDGFLSRADKLRGIFLQKPKGRAAVEAALSEVGVEPTAETVAEVLDRGNLGGEAMVCFFYWAIKRPGVGREVGVFRIALRALGRRKFFEQMELVLERMKEDGIKPDWETVRIVIDSYVRARRICKAINFFGALGEFGLVCEKVES